MKPSDLLQNPGAKYPCLKGMTPEEADAFARDAECIETDAWAIDSILDVELLTPLVIDPCCGPGLMSIAAERAKYVVRATDLHDWGFGEAGHDFLADDYPVPVQGHTVFMNPPFSLSVDFVLVALARGARKIVAFQQWAWWESRDRRAFWEAHPPSRIYCCGMRATCYPPTFAGKRSSTPKAHAWFVWEKGQPAGPVIGHIWPREK